MALASPLHKAGRMTLSKKSSRGLLCFSLAAIAGCGGGDEFATEPGQSILVDSATSFTIVSSAGGLVVPPPQGAACDPGRWTYTVHIDTAQFFWDRCQVNNAGTDPADYVPSTATRTLSAAQLDSATSAARLVRVSGRNNCGADKGTLHLSVISPSGTMVYGDDFYACLKQERAYVESESLDNLNAVLRGLVGPIP
jgi:hypothetical protein